MEQGERKVKQIRGRMSGIEEDRVAALEKQGRALKAKDRSGRRITCRTCTQPTHEQGKCPGKQVIWFLREQTGHFKGLPTCSTHFKKKTNKNLQGTAERTRAVADDTDSDPLDGTHLVRGLTTKRLSTKERQREELVGASLLRPKRTNRSSLICRCQFPDSR